MVLHDLRRLCRTVPRGHRARRPLRGHASLPGAHRVGVPHRARGSVQEPREQGQPVGPEQLEPRRLDEDPRLRHPGHRLGHRGLLGHRVPVLGGMCRRVRGPRQEDHAGRGIAAAHRRCEVRGAGPGRDLYRRLGPSCGQRVPVPDARGAEHRDDEQRLRRRAHRAAQGRRDLCPLPQRPQERVRRAGRALPGRPPHPAAQPPRPRQAPRAGRPDRGQRHLSRPVLPRPPQPGVRGAA